MYNMYNIVLLQALGDLGEDVSEDEAKGIIEAVDKDGDGHINYDGNFFSEGGRGGLGAQRGHYYFLVVGRGE